MLKLCLKTQILPHNTIFFFFLSETRQKRVYKYHQPRILLLQVDSNVIGYRFLSPYPSQNVDRPTEEMKGSN